MRLIYFVMALAFSCFSFFSLHANENAVPGNEEKNRDSSSQLSGASEIPGNLFQSTEADKEKAKGEKKKLQNHPIRLPER